MQGAGGAHCPWQAGKAVPNRQGSRSSSSPPARSTAAWGRDQGCHGLNGSMESGKGSKLGPDTANGDNTRG